MPWRAGAGPWNNGPPTADNDFVICRSEATTTFRLVRYRRSGRRTCSWQANRSAPMWTLWHQRVLWVAVWRPGRRLVRWRQLLYNRAALNERHGTDQLSAGMGNDLPLCRASISILPRV